MKKLLLILALTLPAFANPLFTKYEDVRQGFLKKSLTDVNRHAAALAAEARKAKQDALAKKAEAVAKAPDMAKARTAFAPLSDEMIKLRGNVRYAKTAVFHCPMIKKQWIQPKGAVGNPYDPTMVACGVMKTE